MTLLRAYTEEIRLGVIHDPHTSRPTVLVENVTVCPACRSLHSLRQDGKRVFCTACGWHSRPRTPVAA